MNIHTKKNSKDIFYQIGDLLSSFRNGRVSIETLMTEGYECNPFMYNIANRVAEKIADLPTKFIDINTGEEVEKSNSDIKTLLKLLNNSEHGGIKTFTEKNIANLIALGECFIYMIDKPVGFNEASGLKIISPVLVTPVTENGGVQSRVNSFTLTDVYVDVYGEEKLISSVNSDSVIWGKLPNISPKTNRGLSPFQPNWDVVKATSNSFKAHGVLLENMGANGLLVPDGGENSMPVTSTERTFLQKSIDSLLSGFNKFGKAIISKASVKWVQLSMDANKLEILKMQEQSLKVLCSAVNLDSKLLNDSSASTYNNLSEANKSAYLDCYIPYAETFFKFITDALLPDYQWLVDKDKIEVLNSRDFNFEKETREGILSIQKQVSSGETAYSAGVATLMYVYDIEEDKAEELLGEQIITVNLEGDATIEEGEKSQARFAEFGVGGVQGILAIQQSVAQGITQYEAGISTLVLIYGLDETDARTILGDKQELENALNNNNTTGDGE